MILVEGDRADIAVHDDGDPSRPALVLGHGVGSSSRFLRDAFTPAVEGVGYRLVTYDLRGHGRSSPLPDPAAHTFDRYVHDLAAVVRSTGAKVVGGVSLGGHAAVGLAAAGVSLDGVVACLPAWTGRAVPGEGPHAAVADQARHLGVEVMLGRLADDHSVLPWLKDLLIRDWRTHDPDSLAAALIALDGAQAPTAVELRSLAVPLGLVAWPDDPGHPISTARAWAAWVPCSALEEVTLAGVGADPTSLGRAALTALQRAS